MTDGIKTEAKEKMKNNMFEFWIILIIIALITALFEKLPEFFGAELYEETELFGLTVKQATTAGSLWSIVTGVISTLCSIVLVYWVLSIIRGKKCDVMDGVKFTFNHILTITVVGIIVTFLTAIGFVLLIIPGFIVALGFSQVLPYIVDNPDKGITDVIKESWELMKGHKWEYFVFILSFILWFILCLLVIPMIYVIPYVEFAAAIYYTRLIGEKSPKKSNE